MSNKGSIQKVINLLFALAALAGTSAGLYYYLHNMPNMALLCIIAGVVLCINLIIAKVFFNRNNKNQ